MYLGVNPENSAEIERYLDLYTNYGHNLLNHAYGCASIASALCEAIGVSPNDKEDIMVASYLHDIGETQLPHRFFTQSQLTDRDKELLNKHPQIGVNLLGETINEHTREMILSHHIDVNGVGYGEGIPDKCGEIVRVADIYTALMSPRIYRRSYSLFETISVMDKMADRKHIDKEVWGELRKYLVSCDKSKCKIVRQSNKV